MYNISAINSRNYLVEDVVVTFSLQLVYDTRFLKQVNFDVTSRKFTVCAEVNTDELTLL